MPKPRPRGIFGSSRLQRRRRHDMLRRWVGALARAVLALSVLVVVVALGVFLVSVI